MLTGLCIPTGNLVGADLLATLRGFGCQGIRIKADHAWPEPLAPSYVWQLAQEVLAAGMQPYVSVRNAEQFAVLPDGALCGLGNEPQFSENGWTPDSYYRESERCVDFALESGKPIYIGEIPNLNREAFQFLQRLPWGCQKWASPLVRSSAHRYPENSGPETPHKGFSSRAHEVQRWKEIVGPRPLLIGEVGYNCINFTEQQQADYMRREREFWATQGVDWIFGYQVNDADSPSHLDHYGFRRIDNSWKPVSQTFFNPIT